MDEEIRSEHFRKVVTNMWTGEEVEVGRQDKADFLTENNGTSSHVTECEQVLPCGCKAPTGGACSQCSAVVCSNCLRRCLCGAPLGPCHAKKYVDAVGNIFDLCPKCFVAARRRRLWHFFLSPFVRFHN
ncbi:hypothetical protein Pla144_47290 [Bythopirellula polymerisocia]|uniref:Uncharacterized protein n=1 Tax=Bythopirellula polymerisocia TaxID=2528003 RepID=A0A5C6CET8_9BACT|nr:hypothetical protein Pla144_47290 [Bythopirellula polymerisocia]